MTKDRALRVLEVYASVNGSGQCTQDEYEEAKKMAIKALEGKDNVPDTNVGDTISRQAAIDIERRATVDTNPEHFESHQKFTQFLDDAEISSFGRWQWSNGYNTALTAIGIDLKHLPSAHPDEVAIQLAYMRGKIDGIKECTEKLRKLREEFE